MKKIKLIMFVIIFLNMLLIVTGCARKNEPKKIIEAIIVINSDSNKIKNTKETFKEIIDSDYIVQKIQNKYMDAQKVDLVFIEDSDLVMIVYPCDKYSIDEQKDIVNMYILEFVKILNEKYNIDCYVMDQPAEYVLISNYNLDKNLDDVRPVVTYDNNKYVLKSKIND